MSHLSTERLAALGDEEPTPAEAAHLLSCAECARERAAYRTLVAMARVERDTIALPLTRWDSIAGALAAEQLVTPPRTIASEPEVRRAAPRRASRFPLQAAAAVLLVAGGVIAGRASAGRPALPPVPSRVAAAGASTTDSGETPTANVSSTRADSLSFASIEEARQAQARSEAVYQQAAAFLAQHDTSGAGDSPVAYRSRLAALDQMLSTTREAMREAPHDPVINGYYLTTLGQREATLRQMNTVLPASLRNISY